MYIRLSAWYVFIETYKLLCTSTPKVWCLNNHIKLPATVRFQRTKTFAKGSGNHMELYTIVHSLVNTSRVRYVYTYSLLYVYLQSGK